MVGLRSCQHLVYALAPASNFLGTIRRTLFFQREFGGGEQATGCTMTDCKVVSKQSCSFSGPQSPPLPSFQCHGNEKSFFSNPNMFRINTCHVGKTFGPQCWFEVDDCTRFGISLKRWFNHSQAKEHTHTHTHTHNYNLLTSQIDI